MSSTLTLGHIPAEQEAGLDQHAVLLGSNLSRRHLKLLRKPSNRRVGLTFTNSDPVYQIALRSHSTSESLDVNPCFFFRFFSYSECCAFGFALSVCGVKINVMGFHIAFLSHIKEGPIQILARILTFLS